MAWPEYLFADELTFVSWYPPNYAENFKTLPAGVKEVTFETVPANQFHDILEMIGSSVTRISLNDSEVWRKNRINLSKIIADCPNLTSLELDGVNSFELSPSYNVSPASFRKVKE
jgi:hypothetical protein